MRIYLDTNASYGELPQIKADLARLVQSGELYNPGSIHAEGQHCRAMIEEARDSLEKLLGITAGEARVVFTSGATESNNQALFLPFWELLGSGAKNAPELVISAIEHSCVHQPAKRLEKLGVKVTRVHPGRDGSISVSDFLEKVNSNTRLVSVMLANNETGQILPVAEIAKAIKQKYPDCLVHSDIAQAAGKIPLTFSEIGADLLSISGHKFGALSGTGALIVKEGIPAEAYIGGGAQEQRWRSGTENTSGIVSMGLAARYVHQNLSARQKAMTDSRDYIKNELLNAFPKLLLTIADGTETLPNTLHLRVPGVMSDDLVVALDLEGVSISSGSACSSGKPLPSEVLLAMGYSEEEARQAIRISVSAEHTAEELKFATEKLVLCIGRMIAL